jgi:hypothetical protein
MQNVSPGFDTMSGLQFRITTGARYKTAAAKSAFFQTVEDSLKTIPGVSTERKDERDRVVWRDAE